MVRDFAHRLQTRKEILFVCQGNICRSPFAQAYANLRLAQLGITSYRIISAGCLPESGRSCPPDALAAANEHGVDLRKHRSRYIADIDLRRVAFIAVMDSTDVLALKYFTPAHKIPLMLLGQSHDGNEAVHIEDPFQKGLEAFRACYALIRRSVDALIEEVCRVTAKNAVDMKDISRE